MGKGYRKYKNFLEKFLDSNSGKRFFNITYSVGAAIVIIGAMAKILHWSFGNEMLMIGMITEALVFLLSAFEKPGKDYKWEEVYPALSEDENFVPKTERMAQTEQVQQQVNQPMQQATQTGVSNSLGNATSGQAVNNRASAVTGNASSTVSSSRGDNSNNNNGGSGSSGTVIIGGTGSTSGSDDIIDGSTTSGGSNLSGNITIVSGGGAGSGVNLSGTTTEEGLEHLAKMADNMDKFAKATEALTQISESLQKSFSTISENADGIGNNTQNYIAQLEALNRNIAGLNTIYEVQLKGVSGQIHTIEHINAGLDRIKKLYDGSLADSSIFKNETEKMAQQLSELNRVYARLLQAMTSNMNMGGGFTASNLGDNPIQP